MAKKAKLYRKFSDLGFLRVPEVERGPERRGDHRRPDGFEGRRQVFVEALQGMDVKEHQKCDL